MRRTTNASTSRCRTASWYQVAASALQQHREPGQRTDATAEVENAEIVAETARAAWAGETRKRLAAAKPHNPANVKAALQATAAACKACHDDLRNK